VENCCVSDEQPLDNAAFAKVALGYLRERLVGLDLVYEEDDNALRDASGQSEMTHYLDNARAEFNAADSEQRQAILERMGNIIERSLAGPADEPTFLSVAERLLPRALDRSYVVQMSLLGRLQRAKGESDTGVRLASEPFLDHHSTGLVVDDLESMRYVMESDLEDWGVSFAECRDYALRNLDILSEEPMAVLFPGVFDSPWKDNHDSSRIYLGRILDGVEVRGRRVIAIPNRDHLLVTGSEDEEGLRLLAEKIDELAQEPRFAGGDVYIETDEAPGWVPWRPDEPEDLRRHFDLIEVQTVLFRLEGQKDLLESIHEAESVDIFVGDLHVLQNAQTGKLSSWASWAKGVHSFLPEADLYAVEAVTAPSVVEDAPRGLLLRALGRKPQTREVVDEDARFVPREALFREAGELLRPVEGSFPPLWETLGDPEGEVVDRLRPHLCGL